MSSVRMCGMFLLATTLTGCPDDQPADGSGSSTGEDSTTTDDVTTNDTTATGVSPSTMTGSGDASGDASTDATADDTSDSTADDTSGDCMDDCDDGIACTDDACVDGECVNTPVDTNCDDAVDCTTDTCDAQMDCVNTPVDMMCDDGIDCTADSCDAAMGCIAAPDDLMCDDGVGCTTNTCDAVMGCQYAPDDALCDDGIMCTTGTCDAVMDCQYAPDDLMCDDGLGCTADVCDLMMGCTNEATVLVFDGSSGGSTAVVDAVTALGFTPIIVTDDLGFNAAFDAGGFGSILIDDVTILFPGVPVDMQTRLDGWVAGGGRLIFGFWNLDDDPTMQATLDVAVGVSYDITQPIFPDPGSPVDLFTSSEMFPAPITYNDNWNDNGDDLSPVGAGFIAARYNDAMTGPGSIVVTHSDRVITNGFMISEIGEDLATDGDMDGINDGEELLRNELTYVCAAP